MVELIPSHDCISGIWPRQVSEQVGNAISRDGSISIPMPKCRAGRTLIDKYHQTRVHECQQQDISQKVMEMDVGVTFGVSR